MKTIVKKTTPFILVICLMFTLFGIGANAAGSTVAFNKSSLTIGEQLTATFSFNAGDAMYAVEGYVVYDPTVISFVSGSDCNKITDGKIKIVKALEGKNSYSASMTFSTLKAGSSTISLTDVIYVAGDSELSMSGASASVTIKDPSAQKSSNANLSSLKLSAGTLSPAFSPSVTTYNVTIPYDKEELVLSVTTEDPNATCVVEGTKLMKVGANKRVVVVTAGNGAQKRYTINVIRLDESGRAPGTTDTPEQNGEKITVTVGEQTLYIEENFESSIVPSGFKVSSYNYSDKEIPCITDDEIIMLYLSNEDMSESAFYIIGEGNVFTKVTILDIGEGSYVVLPFEGKDAPDGYHEATITINEQQVSAFQSDDATLAEFMLVYAKGPSGITDFYRYDTVEKTIQRAVGMGLTFGETVEETVVPENFFDILKNLNTNGIIVIACIAAVVLLLIVAIIVLIVKIATAGKNAIENYEEESEGDIFSDFSNTTEQDYGEEE